MNRGSDYSPIKKLEKLSKKLKEEIMHNSVSLNEIQETFKEKHTVELEIYKTSLGINYNITIEEGIGIFGLIKSSSTHI